MTEYLTKLLRNTHLIHIKDYKCHYVLSSMSKYNDIYNLLCAPYAQEKKVKNLAIKK